jgi:uncharacterized protein YaiI (UPF0178 family)
MVTLKRYPMSHLAPLPEIFVDADACPVKDEVLKVTTRHGLKTIFVSDGGVRPYPSPLVTIVVVSQGADAADDWIVENIQDGDITITNDIPLADRCFKRGAIAIRPNGITFTEDSIGMALATRDLMAGLRETGEITGGPAPFSKQDRSRFLQALETTIQAKLRR